MSHGNRIELNELARNRTLNNFYCTSLFMASFTATACQLRFNMFAAGNCHLKQREKKNIDDRTRKVSDFFLYFAFQMKIVKSVEIKSTSVR